MTNVSIPVANMLKNSSTLAVSVAINISMKLCFVSVNGPRETYLLDEPRI
jgi:predicted TIM-barrel enzyme